MQAALSEAAVGACGDLGESIFFFCVPYLGGLLRMDVVFSCLSPGKSPVCASHINSASWPWRGHQWRQTLGGDAGARFGWSQVTGFQLLNNSHRQPKTVATALGDPSHDSVTKMHKLFHEGATKLLTMKTENTQGDICKSSSAFSLNNLDQNNTRRYSSCHILAVFNQYDT